MAATKETKLLRQRAAAAACALLAVPSTVQAAAQAATPAPERSLDSWAIDTSIMRYNEAERITVNEPQVAVRRNFSDDRSLNILVTVDSITGATPLGTLPATSKTAPNTVTNASGRGTNPIIGKVPLSNMTDTRYAVDTSWQQPLGNAYTGLIGANASKETDYISLGANSKLARDFNEKNTTISFGLAPEFDISNPNGGLPVAYSTQFAPGSIDGTRDTKLLLSGVAGITQIINRRTLMQFNYGLTHENGYLNDPYKLLSVIDDQGNPLSAVYEKRPSRRTEQSFYWLTKYNIWTKDVVSLGLRYYTDDWGIRSQTLDFSYRRQSSDHFFWEPHVRYYSQSAADFYRLGILSGQGLPDFASADLRLAQFSAVTFGVQIGYTMQNGSLLIVRAEYYTQEGDNHPAGAIGAQRAFDLSPTLNASIVQIEYQFDPATLWKAKQ